MTEKSIKSSSLIKGTIFALLAFFLFSIMNVLAKLLTGTHHVIEIAFYRNLMGTFMLCALILFTKRSHLFRLNSKKMAIIRAIIGTVSLVVTFSAFQLLPLANAQTILFATAFIIPIMGILFLGETVGFYRWLAICAGFLGVLLVTGPTAQLSLIGLGMALTATLLHATIGIMLRYLGQRDDPLTITFYFLLTGLILTAPPMLWLATMPTRESMLILLGIGIAGTTAQLCLSCAYCHMQAALMGILSYSGLIWAILFGWLLWSDLPSLPVISGALVIIGSNGLILWREHKTKTTPSV